MWPVFLHPRVSDYPNSYWRSLHYFNLYRLTIGGALLLAFLLYRAPPIFGTEDPARFYLYSVVYVLLSIASVFTIAARWPRFTLQLGFHILADIAFVVASMSISGGIRSGLGLLLVVSLASAGLISRGRLALFWASLASIAVLVEHALRVAFMAGNPSDYFQAGLLSMGFFATAWVAHILAGYTLASEQLAQQRGVDLKNLAQVNQLVIQDMQDGVMVVDGQDQIVQRNVQVEKLLGAAPAAREQGELLLDQYSPALAQRLKRWREDPAATLDPLRVQATNKQVRVRFVPVDAERAHGALIYLEDLSQVQAQAQQMKLAALGRLTANIAHEIRNPLSAISHATQLLQEDEALDKTQARMLEIIQDNTHRLDRLVQEVLQLNRRDRAKLEVIKPRSFLRAFVDDFCQAEKIPVAAFSIEVDSEQSLCFDRFHLNQVLWNLCRNAWRHSQQRNASIRLCVTQALYENTVQLDVIDDGVGVDPTIQPQLFEPFFTTDSKGTGLGLYIAKEVCEANGASLDYIEVAPGGQFRICCKGAPC